VAVYFPGLWFPAHVIRYWLHSIIVWKFSKAQSASRATAPNAWGVGPRHQYFQGSSSDSVCSQDWQSLLTGRVIVVSRIRPHLHVTAWVHSLLRQQCLFSTHSSKLRPGKEENSAPGAHSYPPGSSRMLISYLDISTNPRVACHHPSGPSITHCPMNLVSVHYVT
jgi:hypothetical protein